MATKGAQAGNAYLSNVGTLSAHVRPGDDLERLGVLQAKQAGQWANWSVCGVDWASPLSI
jgi:hypothetical protein